MKVVLYEGGTEGVGGGRRRKWAEGGRERESGGRGTSIVLCRPSVGSLCSPRFRPADVQQQVTVRIIFYFCCAFVIALVANPAATGVFCSRARVQNVFPLCKSVYPEDGGVHARALHRTQFMGS